jgi:serine protease Do
MNSVRAHAVLALWLLGLAAAAPAAERAKGSKQAESEAEGLLSAVVQVRMKAIRDARSNETLGETREGTGVVIDTRGHIVTIGYVVMEADSIEVTTSDDRTFPATLAGYDHASGFGLLRATMPLGVKPMEMGDAAALAVNDPVMILPAGGREAASFAHVVSRRRFTGSWEYMLDSAIFTSPPTLQWAGAALVSRQGKLVGIGSLLVRDTVEPGTPQPGNMFVPIDLLKPILAELIASGRRAGAPRPWLGIATEEVQGRLLVTRVSRDGPAERAGIRRGDIVVGVGGTAVASHEEFYGKMWSAGPAGAEIALKVLQGTELRELKVRSIDRLQYFKQRPTY